MRESPLAVMTPVVLEVGLHTIALSDADVAWVRAALAGDVVSSPDRFGLAARFKLAAAEAARGGAVPFVLSQDQRQVLARAVEERLADETAPSESVKLLAVLLAA